jgi:hypothetical protein
LNSPKNLIMHSSTTHFFKKKNNIVQDLSQQVSHIILHTIYNNSCVQQFVILCCYTATDKQVTTSRTAIQECAILLKWQFKKRFMFRSCFQECKNHFTIVLIPNFETCIPYDPHHFHLQWNVQQIMFICVTITIKRLKSVPL